MVGTPFRGRGNLRTLLSSPGTGGTTGEIFGRNWRIAELRAESLTLMRRPSGTRM